MAEFRPATPDQAAFLDDLVAHRLLVETGAPGVYGRGGVFEDVRARFDALVSRAFVPDAAELLRFPPLLPRRHIETTGYLSSFPHLAGTVFAFEGSEADAVAQHQRAAAHEDWSEFQRMTDLMLMPAACYPVYPAIAARGPLGPGGVTIDTGDAYAFRHEPSGDPARLQIFHMRELVRIGEPEVVTAWRDAWRDRSIELLRGLGLDAQFDVAADPFFGRGGRMLAANQRQEELKFEVLVPIAGPTPDAVASFNYHRDHFTGTHGIERADGGPAHTACLGFGEERIVLALLAAHGLDVAEWPEAVRAQLWAA
jgi:seryl-tRNA synthetase